MFFFSCLDIHLFKIDRKGVLVESMTEGGPLATSSIIVGCHIVAVNGVDIRASKTLDLLKAALPVAGECVLSCVPPGFY